jgi:hypothetical protein
LISSCFHCNDHQDCQGRSHLIYRPRPRN